MFELTYNRLAQGVNEGWKQGKSIDDVKLMLELKTNVAVFSAFKSHTQGAEYVNLLVDENGEKRSWSEFRKLAIEVDREYNRNWLATEYNMATRQARAAEQWTKFVEEKKVYPNLEYMPSQSADPSDEHMKYYGVIKPINDPFWDTALPPSRWGCKCWVKQTKSDPTDQEIDAPAPLPGIEGNPGKSGRVFSATSPFVTEKSKKDRQMIQENLKKLRNPLNDQVEMKNGKNTISVHVNAHLDDLSSNIQTAKVISSSFKYDVMIRQHFDGVNKKTNPEFEINGVIADQVKFNGENVRNHISNTFTKKAGSKGQMKDYDECIIIFDLSLLGKNENLKGLVGQLYSKMNAYPNVKYVVLLKGEKALKVKQGFDPEQLYKNIKGKIM